MRPALPLTLTLSALLSTLANAQKCAAPPLNLPIRSVPITPGALSRGIPFSIGTPFQPIVLAPSLQLDNTFIPRYSNSCVHNADMPLPEPGNNTRRALAARDGHPGSFEEEGGSEGAGRYWAGRDWKMQCAELYGGGFNPGISSTFKDNGTNDQLREDWFRRLKYAGWHFVTERGAFADLVEVYVERHEKLPEKRDVTTTFILPEEKALFGNMSAAAMGLTPQSTLLKALYEGEMVPSRSWSLTNESLCLGCVDASASKGDFKTFNPADRNKQDGLPCLLQTKVEALNYHPNAQTEGATLISKTFTTCIDPGIPFFVLPPDARQNLPGILDREVKENFDDYIVFRGPPKNETGILTFKLEGALQVNVTIPGAGDVNARESGDWRLPFGKGGWGAYGENIPVLGRPFTDHIVLRWDEKTQEYGIANVNEDVNRKEDLKPLGCDEFPTVENVVQTTPKTSVIVGSILGGFAAGLLFAAAGVFFFRRGQKGISSKYEPMRGEDAVALRAVSSDGRDSRMSGALPPPSVRETIRSHFSTRSVSPMMEPQLVDDGQVYEAPEGGTAYPSKRERGELRVYSVDHR